MKKYLVACTWIFTIGCCAVATTVIPPSFDELVSRAEVILQGTVTDVHSQWVGEGTQRHIMTYVTLKVEDAIKGNPGASITLDMLGGTVGSETMQISDAPKFKVGDRDILFVEKNGSQFIPLVGIMHGRFHVQKDETGRDVMHTNEGSPLSDVMKLGKNEEPEFVGRPISAQEFKQAIRSKALAQSQHQ